MFLVVSISGGLVGFLSNAAESLASIPSQLAQTLPRAANYFMSYVLVKALTGSSSALLQPVTLCAQLLSDSRDITPRQKWQRQARFASIEWACLFPPLTNIAVIGIAFSVIAPMVLPFVLFAFVLYWFAHRYNVLYVYRYDYESGGRFFVAALNQLFTGLYVMELCLIGHFFVATDEGGKSACVPHGIATIAVLALTAAYQVYMNRTFQSLMDYLPVCGGACEEVSTDDQSRNQNRYDRGDPSERCRVDTPRIRGRPGERSDAGRAGCEEGNQSTERRSSAEAAGYHVTERSGLTLRDIYESVDKIVWSYADTPQPIIWIPRDEYGISADEILSTARRTDNIRMSDDGAWLDDAGKVKLEPCQPGQNKSDASR